jgi:uncharacterized protein DUF5985
MIAMLAGALVFAYLVAGAHFLRFWRRTNDRLFLDFAVAFWLFALDQLATSIPKVVDQTVGYEYLLRILGFMLIIVAIVDKNLWSDGSRHGRLDS